MYHHFCKSVVIIFLDVVARVEKSDDIESILIRAHVLQLSLYLFQYLPGGMQFAWEIGKSNRGKNRYGNIVSCEYIPSTLYLFLCNGSYIKPRSLDNLKSASSSGTVTGASPFSSLLRQLSRTNITTTSQLDG